MVNNCFCALPLTVGLPDTVSGKGIKGVIPMLFRMLFRSFFPALALSILATGGCGGGSTSTGPSPVATAQWEPLTGVCGEGVNFPRTIQYVASIPYKIVPIADAVSVREYDFPGMQLLNKNDAGVLQFFERTADGCVLGALKYQNYHGSRSQPVEGVFKSSIGGVLYVLPDNTILNLPPNHIAALITF